MFERRSGLDNDLAVQVGRRIGVQDPTDRDVGGEPASATGGHHHLPGLDHDIQPDAGVDYQVTGGTTATGQPLVLGPYEADPDAEARMGGQLHDGPRPVHHLEEAD